MNFWRGKRVFVTGAGGFIGKRLIAELGELGAVATGLVRDDDYRVFGCDFVEGDVRDYARMREIVSSREIEIVFHFAACSIVRTSARDPLTTYDTNVMGTVSLLEAIRNVGGCRAILVASSDKAYGDHDELPYKETHALQPRNTYDVSKACMDMIARSYAHNYGLPVAVTRCSNVYGPGDPNGSRLVPNTISRVRVGERPIVYSDIAEMQREFIFIDDVVRAYVMLARSVFEGEVTRGLAWNIGGTGPAKILDVVDLIARTLGRPDLKAQLVARDPTFKEIARQYIDASSLERQVGWTPHVSLADGIQRTCQT